jgi:mono/diheme cytochrome c family protein
MGEFNMKATVIFMFMALTLVGTRAGWAATDGAALYKSRCANCHGPNGEGKSSLNNSQLKGKSLDVNHVTDYLLKGNPAMKAPHKKGFSNLNEDQAKALAEFVKTLQ